MNVEEDDKTAGKQAGKKETKAEDDGKKGVDEVEEKVQTCNNYSVTCVVYTKQAIILSSSLLISFKKTLLWALLNSNCN